MLSLCPVLELSAKPTPNSFVLCFDCVCYRPCATGWFTMWRLLDSAYSRSCWRRSTTTYVAMFEL